MYLTPAEIAKCKQWLSAYNAKWQVLERGTWSYTFHEKTLVRYLAEVTVREDIADLVLRYLSEKDANGNYYCAETLSILDQKLDSSWTPVRAWFGLSNKANGAVAAVRLYHAFVKEGAQVGDGPYLIEDGCAYKVNVTYFWKQSAPPSVPASTSGVSYRIGGVSRDPENGLYSYAIERRERVEQNIPEYVTGITTTHQTSEEVHHGVRGDLDAGGKPASVSNGRIVQRKVTKNPDCTHDVHNAITQELASPAHSKSVGVTLSGTTETTTDLNMPAPLPTSGLDVGQHVENTKTEGGLWRRVFRRLVPHMLLKIAESCRKTIFAHAHSTVTVQSDDPGFTHVEEAGGGVVRNKRVSRTESGAYQITEEATEEQAVAGASQSVSVGLDGVTRTVTNRGQQSPAPGPANIGEGVQNTKTDGGRWTTVVRSLVPHSILKIAASCASTVYQHVHSTVKVQSANPGEGDVPAAGGGVHYRRDVSRTAAGAYRVSDTATRETPVPQASRTARMTLNGMVVRTEDRNMPSPAPDPAKVGESVTNSVTPGGRYNIVSTKEGAAPAGVTGEACAQDNFTHQHSTTRNEKTLADPETAFEKGRITRKSGNLTGNGTANNTTTVTTAKPHIERNQYRRGDGAIVHTAKWTNWPQKWTGYPEGADGLSVTDRENAFGLHDGSATWLTNAPRRWVAETKFIKHGQSQNFYEVEYNPRTRTWRHRKWTVQVHHIRGDAYTDYLADEMRADMTRTTTGIMCTRLLGTYTDRDGNLLAEWRWVQLTAAGVDGQGNPQWQSCNAQCPHAQGVPFTQADFQKAARRLLGGSVAAVQGQGQKDVAQGLDDLPVRLAMAITGQSRMQIEANMKEAKGGANNG